jgi:hypothetical protein
MAAANPSSIWQQKPWWCQPWSIILTGLGLIGGSWFGFQRFWLTMVVAVPVLLWMGYFLLVYPRLLLSSSIATATDELDKD